MILTDDDIPSGSATAGALYVDNAALGKRLLTADVVAVARGFLAGGIPCVDVLDPHDSAIDPRPLQALGVPVLTQINTKPWVWPFIGPMKKRYRVAALVGYHSNAGSSGFRPHTINNSIKALSINDQLVGEVALGIIGFGAFDVPVAVVSGDMNATREATTLVPSVEQVTVRWLGKDRETAFMKSEEASARLREAARGAANQVLAPYRPRTPIRITLSTWSSALMADRHKLLAKIWKQAVVKEGWDLKRMDGFNFSRVTINGNRLDWKAPNPLAAYVSITFAAYILMGESNFSERNRGRKAYLAGRYTEALAAYLAAIKKDPYEIPSRCHLGAVHQKLGHLSEARALFSFAVAHRDEIPPFYSVVSSLCALGLAEVELALGHLRAARAAAQQVLDLPPMEHRHQKAREIMAKIPPGDGDPQSRHQSK